MGDIPREQRVFGCQVSRWLEFLQRRRKIGTATELAAKLGVSKQSVGQWLGYRDPEKTRGCPSILALYAMHEHLGAPIELVFTRPLTDTEVATGRYDDEERSAGPHHKHAAG